MSKSYQNKNTANNTGHATFREDVLAKILRFGVYVIAFVPLIIFKDYISPFHFGKVVIFRSIIEILFVLYICLLLKDRSYLPRLNRIFWAFLAFAVAFSVTTITSILPYPSFWGSLERMGGLWTFWHYFAFFIIATTTLRTKEHWYRMIDISLFVAVLSAFYGFGQRTDIDFFVGSGGRDRIFGTIGNPALFAGYMLIAFFTALVFFVKTEADSWKKWFYGSAIFFSGLAILMTVVRGSVLGLGIGLFIFAVSYYLKYRAKWAKLLVMAAVAGGVMLGVIVMTPLKEASFISGNRYLSRMTNVSFDSYTAKTRFWAWEAGLTGWKESPKTVLVGWGPENFNIPFSKYFNPLFFNGPGSETLFDRAHNMFVEILVTMGLVGFLAYISIFWSAFSALSIIAKKSSADALFKIGFIPLIVAYAIHNGFIFDTSANFIAFFTILAFISHLLDESTRATPHSNQPTGIADGLVGTVGSILMIGALVLIFNTSVASSEANYSSTRGIVAGWDNNFSGAMDKYKEAIAFDVAGKYEYRHRMAQYVLEYANSKKLTPEITDAIIYAISEVQKNADENPPDYLPLLYISRMYIMLGKEDQKSEYNDKALEYSGRALEISPTFVRTYYEVAQAYLNKKDFPNAIAAFKKAAELNPDVGISYWYWGVSEIESGNTEEGLALAQKALEKGYSLGESEYMRLINIYIKLNDLPKIIQGYEALIGINPKNAQYRASLAVAYARGGLLDKAAEQAREAAKIDPAFEPDAKKFVESIGRVW